MLSGSTSVVFVASLGVIMAVLLLRYIEVSFRFKILSKIFRACDPIVQRGISSVSVVILRFSARIKQFLLVHLYNVSSEAAKTIFKETMDRREMLLNKLRGNQPNLSKEKVDDNVSPYLREIPRIDRGEE